MSKKGVLNHVHTYVKWREEFGEMCFRCIHPDCTHIMKASLLVGKRSMCAICHKEEIILPNTVTELLRRVKPRCMNCSNTREAIQRRQLADIVGQVLEEKQNG